MHTRYCEEEGNRMYTPMQLWSICGIRRGDSIGFHYKGLHGSKPILQIYDCDYIPFDGSIISKTKSIISKTTQFDIMNENYLMEELPKAPRDIR